MTVSGKTNRPVDNFDEAGRKRPTVNVMGYRVSSAGLVSDVHHAWEQAENGSSGFYMACANPHSIVIASHDAFFQTALKKADILIPDGFGIVLAAGILGLPLKERVAGFEFFIEFTRLAGKRGAIRYFFLGSTEAVLKRIGVRLRREFPSIDICGVYSPPFRSEFSDAENARIAEAINQAKPDILWVGMTAPKQEKWIFSNKDQLNVRFIGAVGAVFDFYAGTIKRPSVLWRSLGLEWLPRFLKEPKRLWQRNMSSMPIFVSWVIREKLRQIVSNNGNGGSLVT